MILRLGFVAVGVAALLIKRLPVWKKFVRRSYWLVWLIFSYASLAAAVIVGMSHGRPVYLSGFTILLIVLPIAPFRRRHSLLILFLSLATAGLAGILSFSSPVSWDEKYGVYNLLAAALISGIAIFSLDCIRKRDYEKGRLLRETNQNLENVGIALRSSNEELRKANDVKSDLLNLAAHDLKNPLQAIMVHTGVLKMQYPGDVRLVEKLDMIAHASDNMVRLINELLQTSSIDSGKIRMEVLEMDLEGVTGAVVFDLRFLAEQKDQEIVVNAGLSCRVKGDPILIKEILENLLGNAVKFSSAGSRIVVAVERREEYGYVHVRDEGPGLTAEDKARMFGRFQRLSPRPTGGESSTGLGLAIAKDLAEMQGGMILVDSEPEKGSTFSLRLPACD